MPEAQSRSLALWGAHPCRGPLSGVPPERGTVLACSPRPHPMRQIPPRMIPLPPAPQKLHLPSVSLTQARLHPSTKSHVAQTACLRVCPPTNPFTAAPTADVTC